MKNVPKETPVSGLMMNSAVLEIKRSGYFSYTKKGIWKMAQREKAEHSCCSWLTHHLCCLWHLSRSFKKLSPTPPWNKGNEKAWSIRARNLSRGQTGKSGSLMKSGRRGS